MKEKDREKIRKVAKLTLATNLVVGDLIFSETSLSSNSKNSNNIQGFLLEREEDVYSFIYWRAFDLRDKKIVTYALAPTMEYYVVSKL